MKKKIAQVTLSMVALSTLAISCQKDDNSASLSSIITSGTWRVSYYHESNDDHTTNFNGYTFTFNNNGTMTATNSTVTTTGTWDEDDNDNEFHMSIGDESSPLDELNSGWRLISKTNLEIKLKDDDLSDNEELHFTKN